MNRKVFSLVVISILALTFMAIPFSGCGEAPAPTVTVTAPATAPTSAPAPTVTVTATPEKLPSYNWKISQQTVKGQLEYDTCEVFIAEVDRLSNGRIHITHYPGNLLGDYTVQAEAVREGTQEMTFMVGTGAMDKRFDIRWLRCVAYNMEGIRNAAMQTEDLLDDIAFDNGVKSLGRSYIFRHGGLISNVLFDPLDPQGLKCRVMPSDIFVKTVQAMGFSAIGIPFAETPAALVTGTVSAVDGANPEEFHIYGDSFKYFYAYNNSAGTLGGQIITINLKLWNSLSPTDQAILQDAAKVAIEYCGEISEQFHVDSYAEALDWQIIVPLDGDQWAKQAQIQREQIWPLIEQEVGKDVVDRIRAVSQPLPWGLTLDEMDYGYGILTTEWLKNRQGAASYEEIKAMVEGS